MRKVRAKCDKERAKGKRGKSREERETVEGEGNEKKRGGRRREKKKS